MPRKANLKADSDEGVGDPVTIKKKETGVKTIRVAKESDKLGKESKPSKSDAEKPKRKPRPKKDEADKVYCTGTTKTGGKCKRLARAGTETCAAHGSSE